MTVSYGALGGSRTHTPCGTWPSTMPVYQFQHQRWFIRPAPCCTEVEAEVLEGPSRPQEPEPIRGIIADLIFPSVIYDLIYHSRKT